MAQSPEQPNGPASPLSSTGPNRQETDYMTSLIPWDSDSFGQSGHNVHESSTGSWVEPGEVES